MKRLGWVVVVMAMGTVAAGMAQVASPAPPPREGGPERAGFRGPGRPMGPQERGGWTSVEAREGMLERFMMALGRGDEAAAQLGLDEAQKEIIRKIIFDAMAQHADLRAAIEKASLRQVELMTADNLDEAAILKAVEEAGNARTELAKARVKTLLAVRAVLTEEQRKKLRERFQEMGKNRPPEGLARPGGKPGERPLKEGRPRDEGPREGPDRD